MSAYCQIIFTTTTTTTTITTTTSLCGKKHSSIICKNMVFQLKKWIKMVKVEKTHIYRKKHKTQGKRHKKINKKLCLKCLTA